jgi:hypothetical protein
VLLDCHLGKWDSRGAAKEFWASHWEPLRYKMDEATVLLDALLRMYLLLLISISMHLEPALPFVASFRNMFSFSPQYSNY